MFQLDRIITREKLKSAIQEADSRLIQHLIEAAKCESQRVVLISNETGAVVYCLTYENRCRFYRWIGSTILFLIKMFKKVSIY